MHNKNKSEGTPQPARKKKNQKRRETKITPTLNKEPINLHNQLGTKTHLDPQSKNVNKRTFTTLIIFKVPSNFSSHIIQKTQGNAIQEVPGINNLTYRHGSFYW